MGLDEIKQDNEDLKNKNFFLKNQIDSLLKEAADLKFMNSRNESQLKHLFQNVFSFFLKIFMVKSI